MHNIRGKIKRGVLSIFPFIFTESVLASSLPPVMGDTSGNMDAQEGTKRGKVDRGLLRLSLAQTDIPQVMWEDVSALCALAGDVFENPEIAATFARNPADYLESRGIKNSKLTPNTFEVKIVLSLGDASVKDAIKRGDTKEFLRLLESKGLFDYPDSSYFLMKYGEQFNSLARSAPYGENVNKFCTPPMTFCYLIAAVVSQAAIAYNVAVAVNAEVWLNVHFDTNLWTSGSEDRKPSTVPLQMAFIMGGENFAAQTAGTYFETYIERIAASIEGMESYKRHTKMTSAELRTLIRANLVKSRKTGSNNENEG